MLYMVHALPMNNHKSKTTVVGTRMPVEVLLALRKIAISYERSVSWVILKCIRVNLPKMGKHEGKGA